MSNLSIDLINIKLTDPEVATIKTGIATINTGLSNVERGLTPNQRKKMYSLGLKRRVAAREALQETTHNGSILPPAISPSRLENDLGLHSQLHEVERELEKLLQRVQDAKRVAGHEAYAMTLAINKFYNILAKTGTPGAQQSADRLRRHFKASNGAPLTSI